MSRYKKDYYSKEELLKRKLYFTFNCKCSYCIDKINTHLLCKELFIYDVALICMHLNYNHDIYTYCKNIINIAKYKKNIDTFNVERESYQTLWAQFHGMLSSYIKIKDHQYLKDHQHKTIFNVNEQIIDNTRKLLADIEFKVIQHNNAIDLLKKGICDLTILNNKLYDIFEVHNYRIYPKNLSLYHIDSDLPEHKMI